MANKKKKVEVVQQADKAIVVLGNITEGFQFYGPFNSFDDACNYADDCFACHGNLPSWIATLITPKE